MTDPMLRLPHGEKDPKKKYAFPNPDLLAGSYERVYAEVWYRHAFGSEEGQSEMVTVTRSRGQTSCRC